MKEVFIPKSDALEVEQFRDIDYYAVENYGLPIELMMENAGLQLANLVAQSVENKSRSILIGIGNGNNGGGGLVAARRLSAWGYRVYLDLFKEINKDLPKLQLERALKFGAIMEKIEDPDVWVDAYLGFSQRLPLPAELTERISEANNGQCLKISLDLPTGYTNEDSEHYFQADKVLTLAAPKKILYGLSRADIYVADLGIPGAIYEKFNAKILPFQDGNIIKLKKEIYMPDGVTSVIELHRGMLSKGESSVTILEFIKEYADRLKAGFEAKNKAVAIDILNYYKPLMGRTQEEIFKESLEDSDFLIIAANVHGYDSSDKIPTELIDIKFEKAVDLLLAGEYYDLKVMLEESPHLVHQHSQFGHKGQLIHYCASNAVEIYRQVVPVNLSDIIALLISYGADPTVKIPVYGGQFDFMALYESSAHPHEAPFDIDLSNL
ncbi:NAD(P)H-hydrate epimerase [Portibacter lacus]|uniref:NAD(P)H-hydrate epimerase n=1 Tax=Portibacter lacus TaxID=1099794 RepID=A0AA37WFZ1_9BACT|nr:NAD(P)H-hydrate epimerase [Portibacter lacus]GLR19272.1 hypothetical protein GCM10007940_38880 [Portibacter lacus]